MIANIQVIGSEEACLNPAQALASPWLPTVSSSIRVCASCRSSGVSQTVVSGKSGKRKNPTMEITKVTAPCRMNNHLHPEV